MDRKKEVEEGLKEFEIREVNIVNNKIENNRKIKMYSERKNKREGKNQVTKQWRTNRERIEETE